MLQPKVKHIQTDILIVGAGTAGCMAAVLAKRKAPELKVTILEKAHIKRSGCLAMGLNAVNAYLVDSTPEAYLQYVSKDNYDVIRSDLVLSIGNRLNRMTEILEELGVPLPRGADGRYIARSSRSIVMLGEQLKPLLAEAVKEHGVRVFNRTPAYRLLQQRESGRVLGVVAMNMHTNEVLILKAAAVLIATGGASGIYRPSNPGLARTKTWYCPYNAGSGLAMGLRAGAEMTSFEMRFVALRTKDVIAPTGTLVLGTRMSQCNARGEHYLKTKEEMLGRQLTTCERLLYTIEEHKKGTGPCYVDVSILSREQYKELVENYLNMAPSIVLGLLEEPERPQTHVEIYGSEPYINGGHGMAGFWINEHRNSTLEGLYAVGDVAGGAPKKYITGCFAEAEIAVEDILNTWPKPLNFDVDQASEQAAVREILAPLSSGGDITFQEAEERLQKIMEEYAGGSTQYYETSRDELLVARRYLKSFTKRAEDIKASDTHELMRAQDALDRILLARTLVEHLLARRETRWPCYQTRLDYPYRNDIEYKVFINSYMKDDEIVVLKRELQPPYQISALEGNEL
jgi:adenylylsulfate reductase subunit A